MYFSWVALAWVDADLEDRITKSDFFSVSRNPGFLKPLGISTDRAYRPWLIKPSLEAWQEVVRKINRETTGKAEGRNSTLKLWDTGEANGKTYYFNIRFYRPATICVEVRLKEPLGTSPEEYFHLRDLKSHPSASAVVDSLIGIISSGDIRNYPSQNSYSAKTAMRYPVPVSEEEFPEWKNRNKDLLVGLLINNTLYQKSSPELSETIFRKNKELDVKYAKSAFSMISKQGVLTAYPKEGSDLAVDLDREHLRRFRFLEYALAIQKFVEKYTQIRSENRERADFLLHLCQPYLSENASFPKTVTGSNTWSILAQEFSLEKSVGHIESTLIDELNSKQKYYVNIPSDKYDTLSYLSEVQKRTRFHRNWLVRDFGDKKIVAWAITTITAIAGLTVAIFNYLN
jgi:CBS domain-containing protein